MKQKGFGLFYDVITTFVSIERKEREHRKYDK